MSGLSSVDKFESGEERFVVAWCRSTPFLLYD